MQTYNCFTLYWYDIWNTCIITNTFVLHCSFPLNISAIIANLQLFYIIILIWNLKYMYYHKYVRTSLSFSFKNKYYHCKLTIVLHFYWYDIWNTCIIANTFVLHCSFPLNISAIIANWQLFYIIFIWYLKYMYYHKYVCTSL